MSKEALKLALEALKFNQARWQGKDEAITALREALAEQPQMQPCAGRKCGSTNPNLHSAECFEDYEKATGMAQQEPVAWMFEDDEDNGHETFRQTPPSPEAVAYLAKWNRPAWVPLYTSPPQRKWVGLTDEEIDNINYTSAHMLAREVLAKLKEKNT